MAPVAVHVVYCGGWGYFSRFRSLENACRQKFPNADIKYSSESTPNVSGFFEVTVNGQLVHSKANGQGHVDNADKLNVIFAKIEEQLAK